jgi:hypothetical protein
MAGWTRITENDEATTYADVATIAKSGDIVKMSDIMDINKRRDGEKFSSIKSTGEYDCKLNQSRIVAFSSYSENMAKGKIIDSTNYVHDWLPVRFGGAAEALWESACGKQ